jgi:hypothetical protein
VIFSPIQKGALMARMLANRPRYRNMARIKHFTFSARQKIFAPYWSYRRSQRTTFEKHAPGYSLSLIPLKHRLAHQLVVYPC